MYPAQDQWILLAEILMVIRVGVVLVHTVRWSMAWDIYVVVVWLDDVCYELTL